ncbi:MAG: hypothetical protein HY594_03655 [Candidatus Omnitrophica bacterium]|nr:hypothetical protein [Candidatus Omnitrophota bacterium]
MEESPGEAAAQALASAIGMSLETARAFVQNLTAHILVDANPRLLPLSGFPGTDLDSNHQIVLTSIDWANALVFPPDLRDKIRPSVERIHQLRLPAWTIRACLGIMSFLNGAASDFEYPLAHELQGTSILLLPIASDPVTRHRPGEDRVISGAGRILEARKIPYGLFMGFTGTLEGYVEGEIYDPTPIPDEDTYDHYFAAAEEASNRALTQRLVLQENEAAVSLPIVAAFLDRARLNLAAQSRPTNMVKTIGGIYAACIKAEQEEGIADVVIGLLDRADRLDNLEGAKGQFTIFLRTAFDEDPLLFSTTIETLVRSLWDASLTFENILGELDRQIDARFSGWDSDRSTASNLRRPLADLFDAIRSLPTTAEQRTAGLEEGQVETFEADQFGEQYPDLIGRWPYLFPDVPLDEVSTVVMAQIPKKSILSGQVIHLYYRPGRTIDEALRAEFARENRNFERLGLQFEITELPLDAEPQRGVFMVLDEEDRQGAPETIVALSVEQVRTLPFEAIAAAGLLSRPQAGRLLQLLENRLDNVKPQAVVTGDQILFLFV